MDFKPNEFFLGLVDFIAIFLPGCLLAALLLATEAYAPLFFKEPLYSLSQNDGSQLAFWVCFIFCAYALGNFLSSIASGLDTYSDKIRNQIYPHQEVIVKSYLIHKSLNSSNLSDKDKEYKNQILCHIEQNKNIEYQNFENNFLNNFLRKFFHFLFEFEWSSPLKLNAALPKVATIKPNTELEGAVNHYQWSSIILDTLYPAAADRVNRFMAASKFFRSLVVVFIIAFFLQLTHWLPETISKWIWLGLTVLSFREYVVQRQKSIQAAYRSILTLAHLPDKFKKEK
jgi:hypothetical protein